MHLSVVFFPSVDYMVHGTHPQQSLVGPTKSQPHVVNRRDSRSYSLLLPRLHCLKRKIASLLDEEVAIYGWSGGPGIARVEHWALEAHRSRFASALVPLTSINWRLWLFYHHPPTNPRLPHQPPLASPTSLCVHREGHPRGNHGDLQRRKLARHLATTCAGAYESICEVPGYAFVYLVKRRLAEDVLDGAHEEAAPPRSMYTNLRGPFAVGGREGCNIVRYGVFGTVVRYLVGSSELWQQYRARRRAPCLRNAATKKMCVPI